MTGRGSKLRSAGVAPEDIDVVLCTHLHVDHVGWNTRLENGRWVPTFPNARYLIAQQEWDYWGAAGPAALERTGDYICRQRFADLQVRTGGPDRRRARAGERHIALETAPGHAGSRWCVSAVGDAKRSCARSHASPAAGPPSDMEHELCVDRSGATHASRVLQAHADSGRPHLPYAFSTPTGGTITRDGAEYDFVFDGEVRSAIRA